MFCTSLRKRLQWKSVVKDLLASETPRYQEKSLQTHDVALRLLAAGGQEVRFRLLLISATDLAQMSTGFDRINRLSHVDGGRNVGLVFLLEESDADKSDGTLAFLKLQTDLITSSIYAPLLPISATSTLLPTLFEFARQMHESGSITINPISPGLEILPYVSANPPMSEHTRNLLSDLVPNLVGLAEAATTADGQAAIRGWLEGEFKRGASQADDVIDVWATEYVVQ